jgi:hypothetical protein
VEDFRQAMTDHGHLAGELVVVDGTHVILSDIGTASTGGAIRRFDATTGTEGPALLSRPGALEQVRGLASEALERAMAVLTPRRALIDDLVNRLIEMETIDGDSFRTLVEAHEAAGGSALAAQAGSKADVEAAQVGV